MKKIFLIVQKKDNFSALSALRELGIVHVAHEKIPESPDIAALKEQIQRINTVLDFLTLQKPVVQKPLAQWPEKLDEVLNNLHLINQLSDDITKRHAQIAYWQDWGDFDPQDVERLKSNGLCARLFKIPIAELAALPADVVCEQVFIKDKIAHCLVIYQEKKKLPFEEVALPAMSLSQMRQAQKQDEQRVEELQQELDKDRVYQDVFENIMEEKQSELRLHQALAGMGERESLSYLKGFCPNDVCPKLQAAAKKAHWGLIIDEPSQEDPVPTLLQNPRWVEMIKPVFKMISVLPGYKEQDISLVFLLFFSLFFGILIGDAGYGLVFAVLTGFAQAAFSQKLKDKNPFYLMYILSGMTIFWGVLTGTFFGQTLFPGIRPLVPWLNDVNNVQRLCFFIGAVHLSIAHVWRGILKWPSVSVFSEAGWLCLLWGMFFMARVLVLGEDMARGAEFLFIIGPALVLFFAKPSRNPLRALGGGLGDLALNVVNTFTDIVSYIRLFAVGLATVAVADAFNAMALELGFGNVLSGFFSACILILGHTFNMILGAMAILVHGIRLNVLEFSSHMNLEWAGIKYQPLKKTQ